METPMFETAVAAELDHEPPAGSACPGHARDLEVGEFIRLRRAIHSAPELAFEEHRTAALVAAKLESWGYAVERGVGGTGVVAAVRGLPERHGGRGGGRRRG